MNVDLIVFGGIALICVGAMLFAFTTGGKVEKGKQAQKRVEANAKAKRARYKLRTNGKFRKRVRDIFTR